jgi:hypothetical protein
MTRRGLAALLLALVLAASGPACLFHRGKGKKAKAPTYPAQPIRVALLPLNVPSDDADLQRVSLAAVALLAKEAENAQDLEIVPVWQVMPVATEALGSSRTVTEEIAAYVASRVSAKWATVGELKPGKNGVSLLLDLIPAKTTLVAYRYRAETRAEALSGDFREAIQQFLRYQVARPLPKGGKSAIDAEQLKEISTALDREHGWFGQAEPGKAEKTFAGVARNDDKLARLLFNPSLYQPAPAPRPAAPSSGSAAPPAPSPAPVAAAPAPAAVTTAPQPSPPAATANAERREAPEQPAPPVREFTAPVKAPPVPLATAPPPRTPTRPERKSPAAASPAPAATPEKAAAGGIRVQVLSTRSKKEADAKTSELKRAGFVAVLEEADLKEKGVWYRLRLEGFETREAALAVAKKLQEAHVISDYWLVP